jgi:hypothetical protein
MNILQLVKICTFGLAFLLSQSSCDNLPFGGGENEEESEPSESGDQSSPDVLNIGGMPSEDEVAEMDEMDLKEASTASEGIQISTSEMPLKLAIDDDSASLVEGSGGEDCEDQLFCFAQMFGGLQNLVTEPIACNMKLLLLNPDGSFKKDQIRKMKGHPVYYVDGWGTIGLGDNGPECPKPSRVKEFVDDLMSGNHKDDDEFYMPTRYVMFKNKDGTIRWKIVFFPADYLKKLAKKLPFVKDLLDKETDFAAYTGVHTAGEKIGSGTGTAMLDFTEFARMMKALPDDDGDSDDGGMPSGKVRLTYDRSDGTVKYQTYFLDGFSFGDDDGDSPQFSETPITVMHSGEEHFFHMNLGGALFGSNEDDPDDDGGPFQ